MTTLVVLETYTLHSYAAMGLKVGKRSKVSPPNDKSLKNLSPSKPLLRKHLRRDGRGKEREESVSPLFERAHINKLFQ
jgi:hypothetical protein